MAAVLVQIRGTLYDLMSKSSREVLLQGEASLVGLGVGGGPIIPPEGGGGGGGEGIWGPPGPWPTPPIHLPPEGGGGSPPSIWPSPGRPAHPIVLPPEQVPPDMKPPEVPPAGTTTPVPPPAGSGGWPVSGIVPPPYVVLQYPGVGPIYVTPPTQPTPS